MSDYVNIYECPQGCKAQGGKPIAATVRGWKKHMTKQHGGWSETELQALVGVAAPSAETTATGKDAFLKENQTPEQPIPIDRPARTTAEEEAAKAVEIKTDAMGKKFNSKLNKMKRSMAEKLPQALGKAVAEKGPDWALDKDDMELLTESIENCFDVLDIDFKITPFSTVLSNPLWVLLLPLLALILVFVPKSMTVAQKAKKEKEETKEDEERVPVHTD